MTARPTPSELLRRLADMLAEAEANPRDPGTPPTVAVVRAALENLIVELAADLAGVSVRPLRPTDTIDGYPVNAPPDAPE
jgi:hypothetical protein